MLKGERETHTRCQKDKECQRKGEKTERKDRNRESLERLSVWQRERERERERERG